jgi:uncharacterized protein
MRKYIFCLAMLISAIAFADDLSQANKLLEAKSYPEAVAMLARLADAGNPEAQLRLGQVHWYGEGTAVDRNKADALFAKAAAAGNAQARQAMALSGLREQHLNDIAWWTKAYDGADLRAAMDACALPAIPEKSTENDAIKKVRGDMAGWVGCHNGFVKRLEAFLPVGKAIPVEVLDLMSDEEVEQAKMHLGAVYKQVTVDAAARAATSQGAYAQWEKRTTAYVSEQNGLEAERQREIRDDMEKMRLIRRQDMTCPSCIGAGGGRPPTHGH